MEELQRRQERDARAYEQSDDALCMLCHAYGNDKRSLWLSCFYDVKEVMPEALDVFAVPTLKGRGYYLRLCKSCRGRFLDMLGQWRKACVDLRGLPKDHDGYVFDCEDAEANVPVRINGRIVMMTLEGYEEWKRVREV